MAIPKYVPRIDSLFRPLRYSCVLFGASVISSYRHLVAIYFNNAFTVLQFLLSSTLTLYRLGHIDPTFCEQNAVSRSVNGIQQILGYGVVVAIYYQTLFRKTEIQMVMQLLSKSDQELAQLNAVIDAKVFARKIWAEVILTFTLGYGAFVLFSIHYEVNTFNMLVFEFYSAINPWVLTNLVLLTFINFCWHIRDKLDRLRTILTELGKFDTSQFVGEDVWTVNTNFNTTNIMFGQIKRIARIYGTLFDAINVLNRVFGLSNLTSIGTKIVYIFKIELKN